MLHIITELHGTDFGTCVILERGKSCLNPFALRMAKTLWGFGCSECKRVIAK